MSEIRGSHCRTTVGLFAEWAHVLDFPDWFGHNWDAFEECLFTADPRTVVVLDADQVLVDEEPRQLATFLAIVDTVSQENGLTLRTDQEG